MKTAMEALSQRSSQPQEDPALDNSQRRSSVASTQADDHTLLLENAPAPPRYPVDDVREMTPCELHQPMNNPSFKVAIATTLPCLPGVLHHSLPIPPGYARVSVDELVEGFEELEIDIATTEGHKKLGDVKRHIILWQKKYIKFPGSALRPPTPRNPSPPPPMILNLQVHPSTRGMSIATTRVHLDLPLRVRRLCRRVSRLRRRVSRLRRLRAILRR